MGQKSYYGWAISQRLQVNGFKWVRDLSEMKKVKKDIFLKLIFNILKTYIILKMNEN